MKSNQDWEKWGEADPLFAVSTWEGKEKDGKDPWTVEDFYANGKSDGDDFISAWTMFGFDPRHCVEIGCGAGRLTNHLAGVFERVTGLDVSEGQINFAKKNIQKTNVEFIKVNGIDIPLETGAASALFSAHVFQHFESLEDASKLFVEIHRVLQPGGSLFIHLPIFAIPDYPVGGIVRKTVAFSKMVGNLKAALNRKRGKMIMRTLVYDQKWLITFLEGLGFDRVEFRTFRVRSNRAWHDFVFAHKQK